MVGLIVVFIALAIFAGTALAYITGAAAVLAYFALDLERYLALAPQLVFSQLDVFALMAMPLFMLVGEIMNRGRITHVLVDFAMSLIGWSKGGLAHVNILTSVFFAGISGSAMADAAALSGTLVPAMEEKGYRKTYAGAITAASSIIGPIIPPSIILIFYGAIMGVDIAALFAAGIVPGLLLAGILMLANGFFARRYDHPGGGPQDIQPFLSSLQRATPALMLPLIIVAGIVLGVMTPTEAAAVAVAAAVGVGLLYRSLSMEALRECVKRTVVITGSIFMLFVAAALVIYLAALTNTPQAIAEWVVASGVSGTAYLLLMMVVFLVLGMVLDTLLGLALVAPVLVPVAIAQGADPIHVGIVVCLTLAMGLVSPPLGGSVLVVSAVTGEKYWKLFGGVLPFLAFEVFVLLAVVLLPELTLFLPRLLGLL
ncbi:MAG: TRAP transporter large permease [Pseudomonadota bacterium]